jgi:Protein of unknown function (DUF5818)
MKRLLSVTVLALAALGLNLYAQQTPSTQTPDNNTAQQQVDTQSQQRTAQNFEGKITKSGGKFVLKDNATQVSYQLDNQDKAGQYEGKNVKVMATMDQNTNTLLHVVDITPSESQ